MLLFFLVISLFPIINTKNEFKKTIKITYCTHMIFMVYVQYEDKCPQSRIVCICIDLFFSKLRRIKFTSFFMLDWFLWLTFSRATETSLTTDSEKTL